MTANTVRQSTNPSVQFEVPLVGASPGSAGPARCEIFRFRFGKHTEPATSSGALQVALEPAGLPTVEEIWLTDSDVREREEGALRLSESHEFQFACLQFDAESTDTLRVQTEQAYRSLLATAKDSGYPYPARAWNYFPRINEGEADEERYRQFSVGRAAAFAASGFNGDTFPAGTGIGTRSGHDAQIVLLSSNGAARFVENTRQTSAYEYPREHGPVGPTFARASLIGPAADRQLLVSGTASIVGSKSLHHNDVAQQLEKTLTNINTITDLALSTRDGAEPSSFATPLFRVYLRIDADREAISKRIRQEYGDHARIFFLQADICRSELLIEIESVFWGSSQQPSGTTP